MEQPSGEFWSRVNSLGDAFLLNMKQLLNLLFLLLSASVLLSQEMPVGGADITACEGFLVDNGMSASDYGPNDNSTITIYAVAPETITNLYFAVFSLGNGDILEIYDGPDMTAPLMGTYTGNQLQTTDITSTNPFGCLTVHFESDGSDNGNFTAEISCGPPCERPFAIVQTDQEPTPILLCPGEELVLDGSNSTFAAGAQLAGWEWVFDDGTNNTSSWPTVTHAWDEPGGYKVQLLLTDDNDCHNNNLTDYIVFVSTYPDFSLMSPQFDLCQGGLEYMGVNFFIPDSIYGQDSLNNWISEPWVDLPSVDLGGFLYIPDDQTNCFSDELTFTNFDYGATVTSISDLDYFYINFEHSFMGDITITFICPNGQSIAVHQQGGGGTFLGEPIDGGNETAGDSPGVGYDYYWAPDATLGTWSEESAFGSGTLPAGTYQSTQAWDVLLGCPLNGTWTVEICDAWGADDGYIFDWGMAFNPDLYGEMLEFTPDYGAGCDSSYWTGPFIVDEGTGCDFIGIQIDQTGTYNYTYTVTNNFGCTFDTSISVTVFIAAAVTAGPDMIYSCDPITLQGGLDASLESSCAQDGGNYEQCFGSFESWIETYCPDNPGDGVTYLTLTFNGGEIDPGADFLYVYNGTSTGSPLLAGPLSGNMAGQTFVATGSEGCLTLFYESDAFGSCQDGDYNPLSYDVSCGSSSVPYIWSWSPTTALSDPTIPTPVVNNLGSETNYVLTGYPTGYPGCGSTDTVTVSLDSNLPNPGIDTEISLCPSYPPIDMFDALEGDPATGGTWYKGGIAVDATFDPSTEIAGAYDYTIVVDGCTLSTELLITVADPEIEVGNDTTICINGSAQLTAWSETDFNNSYVYYWSTGSQGSTISVNPTETTEYAAYAVDAGACTTDTNYILVNMHLPLYLTIMDDTTVCAGGQVNAYAMQHTGGLPPYSYAWTFENQSLGGGSAVTFNLPQDGEICVTMSDACETTPVEACSNAYTQIPFSITLEADTTSGCSPLTSHIEITTPDSLYSQSEWYFEGGGNYAMMSDVSHSIVPPGSYDLTMTLTTAAGCEFTQVFPNYLNVFPDPEAGWLASPQPTNTENALIQFTNVSSGNIVFNHWVFGTENFLGSSIDANPSFQFPEGQGGEYNVSLFVRDEHGCVDKIEGIVEINDVLNIYIPNAVTPDYDGVNDVVFVEGTDIDPNGFDWVIFNRWGDVIHHSKDPLKPWVCGDTEGDYFVPDGVYNYILKVKSETTGDAREIVGYITVLR
jgi:hypothetical protein